MRPLPPDHPPVKTARPDGAPHTPWRDAGRWFAAAALVLCAHAAGAYAVRMTEEIVQPAGAEPAAMVVELVDEPQAPVAEQVAEQAQPETTPEPQKQVEPETPPEPEPVVEPKPEPVPDPVPEPTPEPAPAPKPEEIVPDLTEAPKPEIALPKPVEEPKPVEKPEPKKPEPKKIEKPKPKPEKPRKRVEKPKPQRAEKAPETRQASAPQVDAAEGAKATASRKGQLFASVGVSSARWEARLQAHMQRNARFLQRRSGGSARGLVQITFVIDPSGNVLSARLAGTSGDPALDRLALEVARRASPVPAPPPAFARARMPINLPIRFQ